MIVVVKWGKSFDGYVWSKCKRFRIVPEYAGRVKPLWYRIEDSSPSGFGVAYFGTQMDCKKRANQELKKGQSDAQ